jgi:hypothetical protein
LFSTVAFACAYSADWLTPEQLRLAARTCLWCFGVDWLVDYVATTSNEVNDIVQRCMAVADGRAPVPGDDLTQFLAELRTELATSSGFEAVYPIWRDELRRMLTAMALEWDWRSVRRAGGLAVPTVEDYLDNADNLGFSFVYVTHWSLTGEYHSDRMGELRVAGWRVQRVIRLINDLGSYERDRLWGDLNCLMLGLTRADVIEVISASIDHCRQLLRPLRAGQPKLSRYLARQVGFNLGFYQVADYWKPP